VEPSFLFLYKKITLKNIELFGIYYKRIKFNSAV
jgi:hypothetical protein